jgi:hypothetical protein
MLYAGCRWAKGCHPDEFMKLDGYYTSSKNVKQMFENGDQFSVIQLMTEDICGLPVLEYETWFLRHYNIAQRDNWLNKHNNLKFSFGTDEFKKMMLEVFGVDHNSKSPTTQELRKKNAMEKYGVEYIAKLPEVQEERKQRLFERFGVTNVFQLEETKEKIRKTCLIKYGVENYAQTPDRLEKSKKTLLEKTGYEFNTQDPKVIAKREEDHLKKYGVKHPIHRPEVREKRELTNVERHGGKNPSNNPEVVAKRKARQEEKRQRPLSIMLENYIKGTGKSPKELGITIGALRLNDEKLELLCKSLGLI